MGRAALTLGNTFGPQTGANFSDTKKQPEAGSAESRLYEFLRPRDYLEP